MKRLVGAMLFAGTLAACGGAADRPGATTDVSTPPSGEMAHLSGVRLDRHDGADRLTLEFTDRVPGYTVGYRSLPAHADGSGFEIPLPGAREMVQILLNPATGAGWGGGAPTYTGPDTLRVDGAASVTEIKAAGDFEAVLTWVVGLRGIVPFRVSTADGPPRLVIEFAG